MSTGNKYPTFRSWQLRPTIGETLADWLGRVERGDPLPIHVGHVPSKAILSRRILDHETAVDTNTVARVLGDHIAATAEVVAKRLLRLANRGQLIFGTN